VDNAGRKRSRVCWSVSLLCLVIYLVLRSLEDFMSIRKIPLKEHYYLPGGDSASSEELERPIDPQVDAFMLQIRNVILSDRAIHDQVSSFLKKYNTCSANCYKLMYMNDNRLQRHSSHPFVHIQSTRPRTFFASKTLISWVLQRALDYCDCQRCLN
jgi:hypothetical protein